MSNRARPARAVVHAMLAVTLVAGSGHAQGPVDSAAWRLAGGALGLTAGAVAGNVASILPCTQTPIGGRCVAGATILGGALGLASGIVVGGADEGRVRGRAETGFIGLAVGSAIGFAGRPFFERVGLTDVFTVGVVGGAVGTQPMSAVAGLAVGTVLGLALRVTVPGVETPDVAALAITGVMVGVLAGWIADAANAGSSDPETVPLFSLAWRP